MEVFEDLYNQCVEKHNYEIDNVFDIPLIELYLILERCDIKELYEVYCQYFEDRGAIYPKPIHNDRDAIMFQIYGNYHRLTCHYEEISKSIKFYRKHCSNEKKYKDAWLKLVNNILYVVTDYPHTRKVRAFPDRIGSGFGSYFIDFQAYGLNYKITLCDHKDELYIYLIDSNHQRDCCYVKNTRQLEDFLKSLVELYHK